MRIWSLAALVAVATACSGADVPVTATATSAALAHRLDRLEYPDSKRVDHVDAYHGVEVADPYRWLEDADAPDTREWIEAQNQVTDGWLASAPGRERIRQRLTELWNYERYGVPFKQGGRYFFSRNDGLQNQSVLYMLPSLEAEPQVVLDPNTFSADGTVATSGYAVSEDGELLAYGISSGGSDWEEWRVREVATGRDLPDVVKWIKFSGASWTHDGKGFFYSRYDEPTPGAQLEQANYHQKLYYHRLGTPQSQDLLVYERPDQKEWGFNGFVTEDGRYLIIHVWKGTERENAVLYKDLFKDLEDPEAPVVELLTGFDAAYGFLGNDGPLFWFQTDLDAPRGKVVAIDTRQPGREHWRELIPQSSDTLEGVRVVGDRFFAAYLKDAHSQVRLHDLSGRFVRDLPLPGLGSVGGFSGEREDQETFFAYTSFTTPTTIYRYDLASGRAELFRQPRVAFDPTAFETRQVFYTSKDGTRVPMFITHKKGLKLDGASPAYLFGYGGFNVSMTPAFSVQSLIFMEMGGLVAVPNLRGGGEYGEDWHRAGSKLQKQNTFDDFIAAAEWLVANRYTSSDRLSIAGRSNGGLLVGAAITQRPDLFGAAIVGVGVLDMLRFHKFTIGWGWVSDYGSPDDPEEFEVLRAYSPYHNVTSGTAYPATLITTADHDDRVVPAHSFKFAAAMQNAQAGPQPVLIRVETRAGHGGGKPTSKKIDEATDELSFLAKALGMGAPAAAGPAAVRAAGR